MHTYDNFLEQALIHKLKDKYTIISATILQTKYPAENTIFHLSTQNNLLITFKHNETTLYTHTTKFTSLAQNLIEIKNLLEATIEQFESHNNNNVIERSDIFNFAILQTFYKNMIYINDFKNDIEVKELHSQILNTLNKLYYTEGHDFNKLLHKLSDTFTPEPY